VWQAILQSNMKECKYCGMPLEKDIEGDVCDFCQNDDGIEMMARETDDEELEF